MAHRLLALLLLLVASSLAKATDVYVFAGQSNGFRLSSLSEGTMPIPGGHKIYYYGMKCVSEPESSTFKVLTHLNPKSMGTELALRLVEQSEGDIILIQYCRCGAPLTTLSPISWFPGKSPQEGEVYTAGLYPRFQKYLAHAEQSAKQDLQLSWNMRGLFWHQGESDVKPPHASAHTTTLKNLFWRFRQDLGKDLPIICAEIRPLNPGAIKINSGMAELAENDPWLSLVVTSDIEMPSNPKNPGDVHFRLESCQEIGRRLAKSHARLVGDSAIPRSPQPDGQTPNIVVIFTDDHAQHAISAYGSKINQTPNIDRLARDGMRFNESFVANSICGPSRANLLTGLHSHANGQTGNRAKFNDTVPTFAKSLQAAGYDTAVIGKWHLSTEPNGFDYWALKKGAFYNPQFKTPTGIEPSNGHATDVITRRSLEWVGSRKDQSRPFMLWVSHSAAHRTWSPPTRHLTRYDDVDIPEPKDLFDDYAGRNAGAKTAQMRISRDLFPAYDLKLPVTGDGMLDKAAQGQLNSMNPEQREAWDAVFKPKNESFFQMKLEGNDRTSWNYQRYIKNYLRNVAGLDDSVGTIRRYLEDMGLAENTIVIYTSDQGFFLGDHGWYDKRWMYEESLRTPLIIHWPGVTKPGSTNNQLVQNIDLAPTFFEAGGLTVPESMHGRSLLPLLKNESPDDWRDAIYYHYQMEEPATRTAHRVAKHYGIRTNRFKLIYYYELDEWEMFDLREDPDELRNRYQDKAFADTIDQLKIKLHKLREHYADHTGKDF
ncbi:sulfatase/phosphatase domain-containing protein (plasmid) [Verrucomicrobiaceae bacterium 227]